MRIVLVGILALAGADGFAAIGYAQSSLGGPDNGNAVAIPPPPPMVASPPSPPAAPAPYQSAPPGLVQTPVPPANTDTGGDDGYGNSGAAAPSTATSTTASAPAANTTPPATSMQMTNNWVPGRTAEIGLLDRVDGGIADLKIPVGGQATSGDLQISVLACVTRPADEIADAAIFVNVQSIGPSTGNKAGPTIFHGWMVRSIPAASVVGDSSETLRVANCT